MSYTVLARRYRSQNFGEVVGQEPIARTLQNAIDANRVAHAYLFCGTRGVGKTTSARLFAKALNGGTPEVDAAIMAGRDLDVIEIDAASHTGVDNVRDIIANATYKPMRGKYKIYIIDEVHMLSTSAFNALLKIMEEPPEHVKFILCTTDSHKVPATIQSRCQRFDFRNIPTTQIARHLEYVVTQESLNAEKELLFSIAKIANGSMRDALSLLDRVLATGEKKLTVRLLEELLGLPDREVISCILDAIAAGNIAQALIHGDTLLLKGVSIEQSIESILVRLRDLMMIAACGPQTHLVELGEEHRRAEVQRAASFDVGGLMHMIVVCENMQRSTKYSATPRILFEALLARLAMTENLADVTAIVSGHSQRPFLASAEKK
jgi:DNA polymerase-3 subunit gamma/tau